MPGNNSRRAFFKQLAGNEPSSSPRTIEPSNLVVRNKGLNAEQEISRFLSQATLGPTKALIDYVSAIGIEAWITEQFNTPQSEILSYFNTHLFDSSTFENNFPVRELFRYALWDHIMTGQDLLRQRVALALSEIFVISTEVDEIYVVANGVCNWYDLLLRNAFGNFRDLLTDVTRSPIMGHYLSHANNRKADPSKNQVPDENYAREIMQLFTIGLFYLNEDGSYQLDGNGEPIPTYDNSHITEFAKIFTGLMYDHDGDPHVTWNIRFGEGWLNSYTATREMQMWDASHSSGSKTLLEGYVVPAGQSGLEDISSALDHLFNHQNVPPFISQHLIKFLVKSNPSPEYVSRISAVFKDNGSGVRGDMQAVIRAILLDDEARNLDYITDQTNGKLREPFIRFTHMLRSFNFSNPQNRYWDAGWSVDGELRQFLFNAPSVFNFFSPSFVPAGPLAAQGLAGPEFQMLNSYTAISTINFWYSRLEWEYVFNLPDKGSEIKGVPQYIDQPTPDFSTEIALLEAGNIEGLIYHIELLLLYGSMSNKSREIITNVVTSFAAEKPDDHPAVIRFAIFLMLLSPEYNIQV